MGSQRITDRLDKEIKEMEKGIWPDQFPKEPADSDAAEQPAQGLHTDEEAHVSPASDSHDQYGQNVSNFDLNQRPSEENDLTTNVQEEPSSPKRVSWKSRFTKLKSYHDAEMFKQRRSIGSMLDRINELEADNKRLLGRINELTSLTPKSIRDLATQEEIDRVGEEELSIFDRLTNEKIEKSNKELNARLEAAEKREAEQRASQAQDHRASAYKIFLDRLGTQVPDYAEIDTDVRFEQWLMEPDPASGQKRLDLFKQAEASGDVGRVASFFNTFKKLVGPTQKTLDSKVTPVGNSGQAPVNQQNDTGQQFVPMAEYSRFMDDVTRGKFKGRESEARKIEARFDTLIAQGRLR